MVKGHIAPHFTRVSLLVMPKWLEVKCWPQLNMIPETATAVVNTATVKFKPELSKDEAKIILLQYGMSAVKKLIFGKNLFHVGLPLSEAPRRLRELGQHPDVMIIEINYLEVIGGRGP